MGLDYDYYFNPLTILSLPCKSYLFLPFPLAIGTRIAQIKISYFYLTMCHSRKIKNSIFNRKDHKVSTKNAKKIFFCELSIAYCIFHCFSIDWIVKTSNFYCVLCVYVLKL
jgi:hypothetical protein